MIISAREKRRRLENRACSVALLLMLPLLSTAFYFGVSDPQKAFLFCASAIVVGACWILYLADLKTN